MKNKSIANGAPEHAAAAATAIMDPTSADGLDEQEVAALAYQRWVDRGCPHGSPEEDWFQAERELRSRTEV